MFRSIALSLLLCCTAVCPLWSADRMALVIGVADYAHVPKLANTVNDANLIAGTLSDIGFDVTTLINPTRADIIKGLSDFAFKAETADLGLIYFAGHGVEAQGKNFLLPVDAAIRSSADIPGASVTLNDFQAAVDHARKMHIVILDSCRDNPLPDKIDLNSLASANVLADDPTSGTGTQTRGVGSGGGLAAASPDRGTLIAFAASPGEVAFDGDGVNSPFATAIADKIKLPGVDIGLAFRQIRDKVLSDTDNRQEPYVTNSLPGDPFYLAGPAALRDEIAVDDKSEAWAKLRPEQAEQLQAQASAGDSRAMIGLAMMQLNPASPRYKPEASAALLARAAAAESAEAEYELAKLYEKGIGVPENLARALQLYQASAAKDYPDAVNDLGFFYYSGALGLPIDQPQALKLFRHAADLKQPEALVNVASFIDKGMIDGLGPTDAAGYLYQSLRAGSRDALEALSNQPKYFGIDTWRELQSSLATHGFYDGPKDGQFGKGTKKALRAAFGLLD